MRITLCAALFMLATAAPAVAQDKVLVIDVERVIDTTEEGRELVGKLKERVAEEEKRLQSAAKALQERKKALMTSKLDDKTPEYYELLKKALADHAQLEVDRQFFIMKLKDQIARRTNDIMRGAIQEARRIMRERGADVVISSRMTRFQVDSDKQFVDDLVVRRVICAKKGTEITKEVIKALDDSYRERKRAREEPIKRTAKGG